MVRHVPLLVELRRFYSSKTVDMIRNILADY